MARLFSYALLAAAACVGAVGLSTPALAQEAALDTGDTAWILTSTVLVLMMTIPGVALFYGGMVRKMNVLATVMQTFSITCLVAVLWVVIGYSIAFAEGTPYFGGLDFLMLSHLTVGSLSGTIPESVFIVFQMTFAIITTALIAGAFADRMKFGPMLLFSGIWVIVVYAPVCHWVWGGGFLGGDGVLDFAGGTVVHINCGVAGLVAAIVLGKRLGYGTENFSPHNLVLSLVGASLLWVGWFGFNAGSALGANGGAGMAMLVTMVAAAVAGLAWMIIEWVSRGKPSVLGLISGSIAGLVAITPASGFVDATGAIAIGAASGLICFVASTSLKKMLGYDDSLDAFGIHGVGGIVGAVLTGVFAVEAIGGTPGLLEGNVAQVAIQVYGIIATIVYCAVATFVILKVIDVIFGLRVDQEVERDGLDLALHGETVH